MSSKQAYWHVVSGTLILNIRDNLKVAITTNPTAGQKTYYIGISNQPSLIFLDDFEFPLS